MKTFESFGIRLQAGTSGNVKTICPACTPHDRKPKNKNAKDLSVDITNGVFQCWNCGWKGSLNEQEEKKFIRPVKIELPLSEKAIIWFKGRGINETTLKHFGISEKSEWMPQVNGNSNCIIFPYIKNNECVNNKFRDGNKNFKLEKGAELCIFNYDAVKGKRTAIITEGEIDCLSVFESGYCLNEDVGVCSVPNGASKGNQRLEYLDNSWEAFHDCEKIILATDNDEAGLSLKSELSRRLGKHRCLEVNYPEGCKDLNEVLIKNGSNGVLECLNQSIPLPVEGIHRLTDFDKELDNIYENGFIPGVKAGFNEFDEYLNFSTGQLTMISGVPNSGKSAFLDQLVLSLSANHNWRFGICSFENQPTTKHIANMMACYVGMPYFRMNPDEKMTKDDYKIGKEFLNDNFYWFKMRDEDLTIDGILSKAIHLVKAYGIKGLLIDPYNYIEHVRKGNQSETEYVSEVLTKICTFAKDYDVHVFMVAHPTKIAKDKQTQQYEVPTLYNISGSAHFFNKTDNGLIVHRDRATNIVTVYVQKVRFFINGKLGYSEFNYDVNTGRYKQVNDSNYNSLIDKKRLPPQEFYNPHAGFKNREFDFDPNVPLPF